MSKLFEFLSAILFSFKNEKQEESFIYDYETMIDVDDLISYDVDIVFLGTHNTNIEDYVIFYEASKAPKDISIKMEKMNKKIVLIGDKDYLSQKRDFLIVTTMHRSSPSYSKHTYLPESVIV